MRKTCVVLICSALWFIQPAVSSFAQPPPEVPSYLKATSFEGQTKRFGQFYVLPDVDVISDGFGGYFYSYKDEQGNKTTTNSIDSLPEELLTAGKPVRPKPSDSTHPLHRRPLSVICAIPRTAATENLSVSMSVPMGPFISKAHRCGSITGYRIACENMRTKRPSS